MERSWPLTGRDDQAHKVAAALRPGGAGIVVAGPAGVGKTRLVREALGTHARDAVWAHASRATRSVPLGVFAGIVDAPDSPPAGAVAQVLAEIVRCRPSVLVVDDAHLLDDHSAIVVHRITMRRLAPVVATVRSSEPAPDPVTALWKDDHLPRIDLEPLDPGETGTLLARVLGGPVELASAQRLWSLTRGSPLFMRHLLEGEVAAGRFNAESGLWRWMSEPTITPELADLLGLEIGALKLGVRDVLDVVTLAEPVDLATLAALTSTEDVEQAEQRRLIRVDTSVARLAHPLYGEVRRSAMGTVRARRLRGLVARTLPVEPDPIPRAVLTVDSDLPPDPVLFLDAAQRATSLYDLPLAERLARAAAADGDPVARLTLAATLSWLSRGIEAEHALVALVRDSPDPVMRAMAHLHRAGNLLWTLGRAQDARRAVEEARASGALPLHVEAMSLALDVAGGDVRGVLEKGPEVLRADLPDDLARILVASAVTGAAAVTGASDLLAEAAAVGGLTAETVPAVIPGFGLVDLHVLGHRLAGTPSLASDPAHRMHASAADLPAPARLMGLVVAGHAALARGEVREARGLLQEAWAGLATSGHEFRYRCRTLLATAHALAGDATAAAALAPELTDSHPAYVLLAPDDVLAHAWSAAAAGSVTQARRHALDAALLSREMGAEAYEVVAWQTVVQLGDPAAAIARLAELERVGPRAVVALAHARALTDAEAETLLRVSGDWARLGDLVPAGDAAAQAADLHRGAGRHGSAMSATAHARDLAARSGVRTPALTSALRPLPLTAREREIVTLAARGLSNREVAERLTLSVRTVEGHLYRAGAKLGVSDRAVFADVLGLE
ncbi:AAA family ATPase [Aeromicrobium sp. 636]|uniref:AAA family ATPase n=1 Tax=Aeromicrobium senzhongii TaxID=2663859 RepID=A0A8I0ERU4_9ACTN|nr:MULTISPECIES: LuxR family transcriptional regulator [Aeromicrobium]MBC9225256.1 AAA family ATPase [Aeromicrobium senzhongii]MCQ3997366.1 AAA family ATPase [Aeromicrobium sp. 636]